MDPKPEKESEKHGDIVLLSEIMADSIYWIEKYNTENLTK